MKPTLPELHLNSIAWTLLLGSLALVAGCTTTQTLEGTAPTSAHPTVSIAIYPAPSPMPSGLECTTKGRWMICISEDPIDLTNDTDPILVQWTVLTQGWKFVANKGIKIKGGGWHENQVNDTQYTAWNKKDRKIYKYEINVTNGSDTPPTWDPFIWNN